MVGEFIFGSIVERSGIIVKTIIKKFVCLFFIVCLFINSASYAEIDYSSMTSEELNNLFQSLVSKIELNKQGDIVYDQDGFSIIWKGIGKDSLSFIITNNSGKDVDIEVIDYALNGMMLGTHWNMDEVNLKNGFSFLSSSTNIWLDDEETIETLGITHVNSVTIMLAIKDIESEEETELSATFSVDEELSN